MKNLLSLLVLLPLLLSGGSCSRAIVSDEPAYQLPKSSFFPGDGDYLAIVGDAQEYTKKNGPHEYLYATTKRLGDEYLAGAQVKAVLFAGDMTDTNLPREWALWQSSLNLLSGLPALACTGNHDYTWDRIAPAYTAIASRSSCPMTKHLETYLPDSIIAGRYNAESLDNVAVDLELGGRPWGIISLEFGARPQALAWARDHILAHPERHYIVMTHELLDSEGQITDDAHSYALYQFSTHNKPYSTPTQALEALSDCENMVALLCGHNGFAQVNETYSTQSGRMVPIILFNLQYEPLGGGGLIELWQFSRYEPIIYIMLKNTVTCKVDDRFSYILRYE